MIPRSKKLKPFANLVDRPTDTSNPKESVKTSAGPLTTSPEKTVAKLPFLRISEISEEFQISIQTLRRWRKKGLFPKPTINVGKTQRWNRKVVEDWFGGDQQNLDGGK